MNKKVTSFNMHIRAALGHLLDAGTKTRNTATPRNVSNENNIQNISHFRN